MNDKEKLRWKHIIEESDGDRTAEDFMRLIYYECSKAEIYEAIGARGVVSVLGAELALILNRLNCHSNIPPSFHKLLRVLNETFEEK